MPIHFSVDWNHLGQHAANYEDHEALGRLWRGPGVLVEAAPKTRLDDFLRHLRDHSTNHRIASTLRIWQELKKCVESGSPEQPRHRSPNGLQHGDWKFAIRDGGNPPPSRSVSLSALRSRNDVCALQLWSVAFGGRLPRSERILLVEGESDEILMSAQGAAGAPWCADLQVVAVGGVHDGFQEARTVLGHARELGVSRITCLFDDDNDGRLAVVEWNRHESYFAGVAQPAFTLGAGRDLEHLIPARYHAGPRPVDTAALKVWKVAVQKSAKRAIDLPPSHPDHWDRAEIRAIMNPVRTALGLRPV